TYTASGQRATEKTNTGTPSTRTYCYDPARPHAVAATTTGATCTGVTPQYTYDAIGNTTKRAETPGSATSQTLAWGAEGKLTKTTEGATATDYIYDAEGELLIRRDSTGETVLYTGATEVHLKAAAKWATRSYTIASTKVAVLSNESGTAKLAFLAGDAHGTSSLAVSADDTQAVSKRYTTPFGSARGPAAANWPEDKRFLDKPEDTGTNLTHIGAREYDAGLGQFISVDPVLSLDQHQSLNGYSYANNSPVTQSDPTGLESCGSAGYCGGGGWTNGKHIEDMDPNEVKEHYEKNTVYDQAKDSMHRNQGKGSKTYNKINVGPGEDRGIIMIRYYIHTYGAMELIPGNPLLLGDNRGPTLDPVAAYRMVLFWDTATGEVVFHVAPSHTMPGKRTISSYATGGAPMTVDVGSKLLDALPIKANMNSDRTFDGYNIINGARDSNSDELNLGVHGVQPLLTIGAVDNYLKVKATKDSVTVVRSGNAYPDMEAVQYRKGQGARWIGQDSMAHTSGYDAPDAFGGIFFPEIMQRTWVNGTCTKSCK
ncbi:RHS repeat domain-containing protein, partial [Streptomyces sp. NPDC054956]